MLGEAKLGMGDCCCGLCRPNEDGAAAAGPRGCMEWWLGGVAYGCWGLGWLGHMA